MNDKISGNVKQYAAGLANVLFDDINYEVEAIFYLTQYCNLSCDGCYMHASPYMSKNILPSNDIGCLLMEMEKIPGFTKSVVFSGGEIFTLPVEYLEHNINQVLNRGWHLQMKTNGQWVENAHVRDAVMAMLRRLRPGRGVCADDVIRELERVPRFLRKCLGKNIIKIWVMNRVATMPLLDMAMSVDDKLHPARSGQWLIDIANQFVSDKKVRNSVNLKTFTLYDSVPFFEKNILNNPDVHITDFVKKSSSWMAKYKLNGQRIESYFGNFIDLNSVSAIQKLQAVVLAPIEKKSGRLVYAFRPDGTVGLDCDYLETIGRVPYRHENGTFKTMDAIRHDIYEKLVQDYRNAFVK